MARIFDLAGRLFDLVGDLLRNFLDFARGLINFAFATELIVIGNRTSGLFDSSFGLFNFASHVSTPLSIVLDIQLQIVSNANRAPGDKIRKLRSIKSMRQKQARFVGKARRALYFPAK
jgi:hypothetical protein